MRYTGDRELVAGLLQQGEGVLRWFLPYREHDGLVADVPGWVLIDWSDVPVAGTSAALNALWARGLRDFEDMARWLGDNGRAAWARSLRAKVRMPLKPSGTPSASSIAITALTAAFSRP